MCISQKDTLIDFFLSQACFKQLEIEIKKAPVKKSPLMYYDDNSRLLRTLLCLCLVVTSQSHKRTFLHEEDHARTLSSHSLVLIDQAIHGLTKVLKQYPKIDPNCVSFYHQFLVGSMRLCLHFHCSLKVELLAWNVLVACWFNWGETKCQKLNEQKRLGQKDLGYVKNFNTFQVFHLLMISPE